jgi:type IV secretory pathway VirB4 component
MAVTAKATQEFIPIREIRDGVVILNDNSLHMILMASTLNFALKSEDEQEAIILQYQNFLNSLDFPAQFFIESRKLDIGPYISSLQDAEKEQVNELLKIQTREYIEFVKNFVRTTNVVSKTFYIIVSYSSSIVAGRKGILGIFGKKGGFSKETKHGSQDQFGEVKLQLQQRADVVQQGLIRCGIRVVVLNTEELIELFYKLFNPGELEREVVTSNE